MNEKFKKAAASAVSKSSSIITVFKCPVCGGKARAIVGINGDVTAGCFLPK